MTETRKTMSSVAATLIAATLIYTAARPLISPASGVGYWLCLAFVAAFVRFIVKPRERWQRRACLIAIGVAALLALVASSDPTTSEPRIVNGS